MKITKIILLSFFLLNIFSPVNYSSADNQEIELPESSMFGEYKDQNTKISQVQSIVKHASRKFFNIFSRDFGHEVELPESSIFTEFENAEEFEIGLFTRDVSPRSLSVFKKNNNQEIELPENFGFWTNSTY